ncbi:MAG: tRNA pseudouridine(55) synthase TruB [Erysipelotrichaceae bacterium]|nr:tRNA pseudouridine(55) synthase TruB [Erysipelotrichaceae bacterium]
MDGILLVKKEAGMTSHDVVDHLRRILHMKKIGHTGTLDPEATGVLMVLVGKACKALPYLGMQDKRYVATMELGYSTETEDIWGAKVAEQAILPIADFAGLLKRFVGRQQQIPPMYSSIKVNGRKLYEYARKGEYVERKPRDIEIFDIKMLDENKLCFEVACSSGTYIRTLCTDIAAASGNLGVMSSLVRTAIGPFTLDMCATLDEIKAGRFTLHSVLKALSHYEILQRPMDRDVLNGRRIVLDTTADEVLIADGDLAVAIYQRESGNQFRCVRGLW